MVVGGTVGGYITFAGAHRLLDAGLRGPEGVGRALRSAGVGVGIATVMRVVLGDPSGAPERPFPDSAHTAAPPLALMALVTGLGLWVPGGVADLLRAAAALVTG